MHQGRGLKCLARLLLGQAMGGQSLQLIIDQWQKLVGSGRVATVNPRQDLGNIGHRRPPKEIDNVHDCSSYQVELPPSSLATKNSVEGESETFV